MFSMEVLIIYEHTIFMSPTGDGTLSSLNSFLDNPVKSSLKAGLET